MKFTKFTPLYFILVVALVGSACNLPVSFMERSTGKVEDRIQATFQARTQQAGTSGEGSAGQGEATSTPYTGNASNKKLSSGETAQGIDGVTLAAADQALDKPVDVTVTRVKDPDSGASLGPDRVGEYYQISTSRQISTRDGSPLFLALPIPEGQELDNLGIALLGKKNEFTVEPKDEIDSDLSIQDTWLFRSASIDQEDRLAVITLFHIPENGRLFTVVRDSSFSPSMSSQGYGPGLMMPDQQEKGPFFKVVCHPDGFEKVDWKCTKEDRTKAATLLKNAYQDFRELGFKKPYLYHNYRIVSALPYDVPGIDTGNREYSIALISCPALNNISSNAEGLYRGGAGPLDVLICYDGTKVNWRGGKATDAKRKKGVIYHEVFHAVQNAYKGYLAHHQGWFTEGTATTAMYSKKKLKRTRQDRHDVDKSLENDNQIYRAQDFWVFTGKQMGRGLDYLIPFLKKGADTKNIDKVFRNQYKGSYPSGLSDAYWAWAKYQAFEYKGGGKCALNSSVVTESDNEHALLTSNIRGPVDIKVGALQSKVIRYNLFRLSDNPAVKYQYTLRATPGASQAFSKFYYQVNAGTDQCLSRPDRANQFAVEVPPSVEYTNAYALISNGMDEMETNFQLGLTAYKYEISITNPSDTSTFTQGDSISAKAAFKKDGSTQGGATIKWTLGKPLSRGGSVIGQGDNVNLSTDQIGAQGTYDIYANHVGNRPREAIYDSVTISIQAAEAPDVRITHPVDDEQVYATPVGGSYAYGERNSVIFTAQGSARDAKGNAITGNDLIWSWRCEGCSEWNREGRGTSQKFQLQDDQCGPVGYQLRLVAWDNFGNKAQHVIDILVNVTGC